MNLRGHRALVVALGLTLIGTACSGGADSVAAAIDAQPAAVEVATTAPVGAAADAAEPAPSESQTEISEPVAVSIALPDVEVYDLKTGGTAGLAGFARPGPTLVWFWAPH